MGQVDNATPQPPYAPAKKPGVSCIKRLDMPQGRSGRVRKISFPIRIQSSDYPDLSKSRRKTALYFCLFIFKLHFTRNTFNLEFTSQVEETAGTCNRQICGILQREKSFTYAHIYLNFSSTFKEIKFKGRHLH
jgi:hypothetical protein